MINYLKLKNYKALASAYLMNLGNINIICGKNNSGKTTVLEAISEKNSFGIGRKVDDVDYLVDLFKPQADRYTNPPNAVAIEWFRNYIYGLLDTNTIWYSDDYENIKRGLTDSFKNSSKLHNFNSDIYDFVPMLDKYFEKVINYFSPILIPPIRQLEYTTGIDLSQALKTNGNGVVNQLFFLKNQDLESEDYQVYRNIYNKFFEITGSKFNIVPEKNNVIKLYYLSNQKWIPAIDSGLGLSDILIIITLLNKLSNNVFLIEEPENHIHAEFQKRLLGYISSIKNKQFFITTHSSIFLDPNISERIYYCFFNGEIEISDQTSKSEIIHSLGYSVSDNLVADLIILLEGPSDIPVVREILNWFGVNEKYNIRFWPLGGDNMASLDLSVFAERNNIVALIDYDPGSSKQRTRFIKKCKELGIYCKKLKRYSIENYFPLRAIKKVFPNQIDANIKDIKPTPSVDSQIGFDLKKKSIKSKNQEIVKYMNKTDIKDTDLLEFVEAVIEKLKFEVNS